MQLLYLVECQGYFKIGVAYNVQRRLVELSTGNPFDLNALAVYGYANAQVVEAALHQRFSNNRIRSEWFSMAEDDLKNFHALCQGLGGLALPLDSIVEEDEIAATEDARLYAQEQEQQRKREQAQQRKREQGARIISLHQEGKSQRQIEQEVFGYSGGHAAAAVLETIKQYRATSNISMVGS